MDAAHRSPYWSQLTGRPLLTALLVYFVIVSIPMARCMPLIRVILQSRESIQGIGE